MSIMLFYSVTYEKGFNHGSHLSERNIVGNHPPAQVRIVKVSLETVSSMDEKGK